MLCTSGKQFQDWSADYRLFSKAKWDCDSLFSPVVRAVLDLLPEGAPFVTALDDTGVKKTGTRIPGVAYRRDPMSPPFQVNFIRAQRFCQMSAMLPSAEGAAPARAIPVQFQHVPPVPKPKRNASAEERRSYRKRCLRENLSISGAAMVRKMRRLLDEKHPGRKRALVVAVDGSFCNQNVIRPLPERTVLIGRTRKDTKLFFPPTPQATVRRGRKRAYGERAPTPEELRKSDSIPWKSVGVFAAGRVHSFRVKELRRVLWRKVGAQRPLRLVVIRPLGYRLRKKSRMLYRKPAYLICTDLHLPLDQLIQYYVWRWDIEVNFRDEKQIVGVGQAQVRNQNAVDRVPAFSVASYAMLLLAGVQAYGSSKNQEATSPPKWRDRKRKQRLTTQDLLQQLRMELWAEALDERDPNFEHFVNQMQSFAKSKKFKLPVGDAVFYAAA
jgi:hypothetical protein